MHVQTVVRVTSFATLSLVFAACSSPPTNGNLDSNVTAGGSTTTGTPTGGGMTSAGGSTTSSAGTSMVTGNAGMGTGNAGSGMVTGSMGGMAASAGSSMGGSTTTMGGAGMGGMTSAGMGGMGAAGMGTGGMSAGTGGDGVGGSGMAGGGGTSGGGEFTLTSAELTDGESFADANTCTGGGGEFNFGVSISLEWSGFPPETQSFALTMVDVTLVDGSAMDYLGCHSFFHDLPVTVTSLPAGGWGDALTSAGATAFRTGYLGPCPPNGPDTYEFTLYAMPDATFTPSGNFDSNLAACNMLRQSLEDAALDKVVLSGTYIQP